ncbi:Low-density lipoprotein receptor repeat class B [Cooperia oncophora]
MPQQCRDSTDCHENGHCVVVDDNGYVCECLPGYRGDGIRQCVINVTQRIRQGAIKTPNVSTEKLSVHTSASACEGSLETEFDAFLTLNLRLAVRSHASVTPMLNVSSITRRTRSHACANQDLLATEPIDVILRRLHAVPAAPSMLTAVSPTPTVDGNANAMLGIKEMDTYAHHVLTTVRFCDPHSECVPTRRRTLPDSDSRDDVLLVSRGMAIFHRGINPEVPGKQLVVIPHHIAVGLDYDCQDARFVWSDISGHSIKSASLNGTDMKSYYKKDLNSPEGIAVDWSSRYSRHFIPPCPGLLSCFPRSFLISRNVYYADSLNDEIGVASLDGKYQKALITEGLVNPRALALDLNNKHLYYTDWHRENPLIGRVDMDGRNNRVFLNDDIHLPNGITILPNRRELCWVDAGNHRLSCIGLDGNNRRVVYAPLQYPFGLTHNNEQKFYWTDWKE